MFHEPRLKMQYRKEEPLAGMVAPHETRHDPRRRA
jgi:hypothetical protein